MSLATALICAGFVCIGYGLCGHWPLLVTAVALISAGQMIRVRA